MANVIAVEALAELEALGWKYEPVGEDEVKIKCPCHEDSTASCSLNTDKNLWRCHAAHCSSKGNVVSLLAHITGSTYRAMMIELSKRYDLDETKSISPESVEKMHQEIFSAGPLLKKLYDRGVTDEMIRSARLGYHDGRITIPVYDLNNKCVNIRRYLPGSSTGNKMKNTRGFGKTRLYQPNHLLKYETIWICGGEIKALVVGSMLDGVGAISATAGEGKWLSQWNQLLGGKNVFICMDVDEPGIKAAVKVGRAVSEVAKSVKIIELPLDKIKHPKGDINDFIAEGAGKNELLKLMELARDFVKKKKRGSVKGEKCVALKNVAKPENINWSLTLDAVASAADTTPYIVPNCVEVDCTRDQPFCDGCNLGSNNKLNISPTDVGVLEMVGTSKRTQSIVLQEALGIPSACKVCELSVSSHHIVHDVRLTPKLELQGDNVGNIRQPSYIVGDTCELNVPYTFKGRVFPHPQTQHATLLLDSMTETEDSLSSFSPSSAELQELESFRASDSTVAAVKKKIDEIYSDLETNVTHIFGRRDLHLLLDLAYHSPLFLNYRNKRINGWVNLCVLGDSAQGKTETSTCLASHYGLGERVECKNASVAGLLGGLQQIGNRWFVSWGVIPTHDRRLVILEEVKGAAPEILQKLTDMRSSGIAEIPKIERQRAHARTRLIWISNPRGSRQMSSYAFGIEAIKELLGSLEDVRRFDAAIILSSDDLSEEDMEPKENLPHIFTSEMCRRLVLWAWTRNDVVFLDEGEIEKSASRLCENFDESLPLVDKGTMRQKLARLSAALAARLFSEENGEIVVLPAHVLVVEELLHRNYSSSTFGYLDYSKSRRALNEIKDAKSVRTCIADTRFPDDLVSGLLYQDTITLTDIMDWCDVDREGGQSILSFFVRHHAVRRKRRSSYFKSPAFISLLKSWRGTFSERHHEEF